MKKTIILLVVILLIISSFISKKFSEVVVLEHIENVNKRIGVEVVVHKIWSDRTGIRQYEVFVDYTSNGWLRLVSRYVVEQGQVVHSERVSD